MAAPYNPTTLVYGDRLYVLHDRGFLACYDPRDGKEIFGNDRMPKGGPSRFALGLRRQGLLPKRRRRDVVLKAGDEFELLHTNAFAEDDMGMATPALAATAVDSDGRAAVSAFARPPSTTRRR